LEEISLFPKLGNSPARTSSRAGSGDAGLAGKPGFGRFPCIFPVDQGFRPRDEFAIDCTLRHSVCGCRDFAPANRDPARNSRAFAGLGSGYLEKYGHFADAEQYSRAMAETTAELFDDVRRNSAYQLLRLEPVP
jgi:hypothetical protein